MDPGHPDGSPAGTGTAPPDGSPVDTYEQHLLFLQQNQIVTACVGVEFADPSG